MPQEPVVVRCANPRVPGLPRGSRPGAEILATRRPEPTIFGRWLVALGLVLIGFVGPAKAAIFVVNSPLDGSDAAPGDGVCDVVSVPPSNLCTLRAAVEEANALVGFDAIHFAVGGGGIQTLAINGPNTIEATESLAVRGETQPGFAGIPLIHLHFDGGGLIAGFGIAGNDVTLRSLRISGFPLAGVSISGDRARVEGSWIGLDATGAVDTNLRGIGVGGADHVIGGAEGNVISGNFDGGVVLGDTATRVEVTNNFIGTDPTGLLALGNGAVGPGIRVEGDQNFLDSNLVSGNDSVGIWLIGERNEVVANIIGLGDDGTTPLGNGFAGIFASEGADDNLIGGTTALDRNIISANVANFAGDGGSGIVLNGVVGTKILGNFVGTDVTGQLARGNRLHGIHLAPAGTGPCEANQIGVLDVNLGGGNVISANGTGIDGGHGILVDRCDQTAIINNTIGLAVNGVTPRFNDGDGIRLLETSRSFVGGLPIFGTGPNRIAHNTGAGISVVDPDSGAGSQDTLGNALSFNATWSNGGLAIDLVLGSASLDGVTLNDPDDLDFGPNRLQNFPEITNVTTNGAGTTTLSGTLDSTPSTDFRIEVFDNPTCDPSGHGETRTPLSSQIVTTNGSGFAAFSIDTPSAVVFPTATATVSDPDPELRDTSEVSPCFLGAVADGLLGDFVWWDTDGDGLQGADEPGRPDTPVRLLDAGGTVVDSTITDADGRYRFTGVATGTYRIEFLVPAGVAFTTADVGTDDEVDSDVTTGVQTDLFSYTNGTVDLSRDAGLRASIFADGFESGDTTAWSSVEP